VPQPDSGSLSPCIIDGDGSPISEAKLHAYVDDALTPAERLNVEGFLAVQPEIARRIEAYRSQTIALHAAFNAGEELLPPSLADLSCRYARARAVSAIATLVLGIAGITAMLSAMLTILE
jgi:anti-sigma factor RsiW